MTLTVQNGSFAYKKGAALLENISLEAESGDVLAILGPNGAGKTTLLRCMLNLCRWKKGQTLLGGRDVRTIPERALWQIISYVPQAKTAVNSCTVEQMVLLGRSSHIAAFSAPTQMDLQKTHDTMDRLGLSPFADRRCCELSGGELQMVLIARALAAEPQVLILDEPESNLDFKNQLLVLDTMQSLARVGLTCIFNTHYPAHALRRANRALLLGQNGRSLFGRTQDVVTEQNISDYFGVRAVIGSIQTPDGAYADVIPVSAAPEGRSFHA